MFYKEYESMIKNKIIVAGIICAILFLYGCDTNNSKKGDVIRVGSFNLMQFAGIDPAEQGAFLKKFDLDVVALQEVDKNTIRSDYDITTILQESAGFKESFFSKQMPFQGGDYGLAIISDYEILEKETIHIYSDEYIGDQATRDEQKRLLGELDPDIEQTGKNLNAFVDKLKRNGKRDIEPNIIQKIVVDVNGKKLSIYGVHLSYELIDIRDKQREQLKQILELDENEYQVIVGDFNNDTSVNEMAYFRENFNLANGKDGVWKDTFHYKEDPEETMNVYSIDNIVATKNIEIINVNYEETNLSDHIMIYADLVLN